MPTTKTIPVTDPRIYLHGRWDASNTSHWVSDGFKLCARNILTLHVILGDKTSTPAADATISINNEPLTALSLSPGTNSIALPCEKDIESTTVIHVNARSTENSHIQLEHLVVNSNATLVPYEPSSVCFTFIGDSFSSGHKLPLGVNQAWPTLLAARFAAECTVLAQTGVTLVDLPAFGNSHGMTFSFFQTEDSRHQSLATPWDFSREKPVPTHVFIHLGANDIGMGVTEPQFIEAFLSFLWRARTVYPSQTIFVVAPWGFPTADGEISMYGYYPTSVYHQIVDTFLAKGGAATHLIDTTRWVIALSDLLPEPGEEHLSVAGHLRVAEKMEAYLQEGRFIAGDKALHTSMT